MLQFKIENSNWLGQDVFQRKATLNPGADASIAVAPFLQLIKKGWRCYHLNHMGMRFA